jgi:hypothetical protein
MKTHLKRMMVSMPVRPMIGDHIGNDPIGDHADEDQKTDDEDIHAADAIPGSTPGGIHTPAHRRMRIRPPAVHCHEKWPRKP